MNTTDRNKWRRLPPATGLFVLFGLVLVGACLGVVALRERGPAAHAAGVPSVAGAQGSDSDNVSSTAGSSDVVSEDGGAAAEDLPEKHVAAGDEDSTSDGESTSVDSSDAAVAQPAEAIAEATQTAKSVVERPSASASKPAVAKTTGASPAQTRDDQGVVFVGQSDQIALVKAQMRELLAQMGWTAGQVTVREPEVGERVAYALNGTPGDTNTFVLSQRPQLAISPEVIHYTSRQGQAKTLALVSQKEILATMFQAGRAFVFSGPNCTVDRLKEHIALRQNIVYWGLRADWVFPEDKVYRYNTGDYWQVMQGDDWTLKPGMRATQAVADAFVGKFSYQIGCTSACRFIYVHGILNFFQQVRPNVAVLARLEQILDRERPFVDIAPLVDRQTRAVLKEGRLMDRHSDVPADNWVPGDWGWIKNPDDKSSEELGSEGCNIIYAGGGFFVNYYPERPPKTLDQAIKRVYGWRFGLEESELDLADDLMHQLRQDPRAGGMLRDVRDFPKMFGPGPATGIAARQPGA
ncbi:MAG TPA: hypothetical protein VHC22_05085 [Pirellulales bacterium]|nr:hypothetical protein [Pirellulales bacterium]